MNAFLRADPSAAFHPRIRIDAALAWLALFLLAPAAIVLKISLAVPVDGCRRTAHCCSGCRYAARVVIDLDSYALILGDPLYGTPCC